MTENSVQIQPEDEYIVNLFKKRCPFFANKEEKKDEAPLPESEIDKLFNSEDAVKYEREDIFFSDMDDPNNADSDDEFEEEEKKEEKKDEKKDEKKETKKKKKINLLKFSKLANPGLKGGKVSRTSYQDQFRTLFNNEYLSDVVFTAKTFDKKEEKKLFAHKLILKTRSEYFKKMFESPLKESKVQEIKIDTISYEVLCVLVEYLYTGVLNVTYQNALLILAASNQFLMNDVKEIISEYFKQVIDADVACMLYEESFFHNAKDLRRLCLSYIESNSNTVVFSDAFKQMTPDMVKEIIKSDFLSVDEYKLFTGLLEWAKYQAQLNKQESFKKYMEDVIEFVRFPLMKPIDLRDKIEMQFSDLVPRDYLMEAYRFHSVGGVNSPRTRPRLTITDFKWDTLKKSTYCSLDTDKVTCSTTYTANKSVTCLADVEWKDGLYYWEVKIDSCPTKCEIMIGVSDKATVNVENYLSYNRRGWGIMGKDKSINSRPMPYAPSELKKDDVVGVLLNLTEKTLTFFVNGKSLGEAFKDVVGPLSPAVSLFSPGDRVTLNTKCRPPKKE